MSEWRSRPTIFLIHDRTMLHLDTIFKGWSYFLLTGKLGSHVWCTIPTEWKLWHSLGRCDSYPPLMLPIYRYLTLCCNVLKWLVS